MNTLAQDLLKPQQVETSEVSSMENVELKRNIHSEDGIAEDVKMSGALIYTAQKTLSDLDKSIMELALLVEDLRKQSKILKTETV